MMPVQHARVDATSSEEDLLVERGQAEVRPGQLKVRALGVAAALLLFAGAAYAALATASASGAPAIRRRQAASEGFVQLSDADGGNEACERCPAGECDTAGGDVCSYFDTAEGGYHCKVASCSEVPEGPSFSDCWEWEGQSFYSFNDADAPCREAPKHVLSGDECAMLRRMVQSAKEGKKDALDHLKSGGIDLDALGPGQDPCQADATDAMLEAAEAFAAARATASEADTTTKATTTKAETTADAETTNATAKAKTTTKTANTTTNTTNATTTTTVEQCSAEGDCSSTKCCIDAGMQCYQKTEDFAKCREDCVPGKDLTDVDSAWWSCTELGERTPGEKASSGIGDNCMKTRSCSDIGFACYAKNKTYATCKAGGCIPGPDYTDEDGWEPWTCKQLSAPTPGGKAAWVADECADNENDCREASCCQTTGYQCFEMGPGWAQCKAECSTEPDPERSWEDPWTCQELGPRTPASAGNAGAGPRGGQVATWVRKRCGTDAEDCTKSQCCTEVGAQCFGKDATYAKCMLSCNSSAPDTDGWTCEAKGSPSFGIARKSWPSLFCFSVIHVCKDEKKCYENALMNRIHELGPESAGIFGCDDWNVFANEASKVGGRDTTLIPGKISVGISKDGTAANTELFMMVWQLVIDDGRFKMHDWTVKMDPDAVLLPWKLGDRLAPHTNNGEHDGRLFVVNCNAWPGSDSFPMMYGSVEIFSKGAMTAYAEHMQVRCADYFQWEDWGEDYFITRCMDQLDVGRLDMFDLVGDNVCVGPGQGGTGDCGEGERAAFHPFKTIEVWTDCYNNAVGYHPETPAPAPPEEGEEQQDGAGDWQQDA